MNSNGQKHISLFIADDHSLYLETLVLALNQQSVIPIQNIHTAVNGEDLLTKLPSQRADVLLLDLNMPVLNGLDVIPVLKENYPGLKIIIVTKYDDPKFVKECLHLHQVAGYILKTSTFAELLEGIGEVFRGQSYISKKLRLFPKDGIDVDVKSIFEETFLAKYNLTKRELEILGLVAQAKNNSEIADHLYISPQTVGAHRKNIMRKLNISTTAGLVRFAIENHLG